MSNLGDMELLKRKNWRVKGDIEILSVWEVQGRKYKVVDAAFYITKHGRFSNLIEWLGTCTNCGRKFTFVTGRTFRPYARCKPCRGRKK